MWLSVQKHPGAPHGSPNKSRILPMVPRNFPSMPPFWSYCAPVLLLTCCPLPHTPPPSPGCLSLPRAKHVLLRTFAVLFSLAQGLWADFHPLCRRRLKPHFLTEAFSDARSKSDLMLESPRFPFIALNHDLLFFIALGIICLMFFPPLAPKFHKGMDCAIFKVSNP